MGGTGPPPRPASSWWGGWGPSSLFVGSFPLSLSQIGSILAGGMEGTLEAQVFWQLRFPRMCMGLLAGWAPGAGGRRVPDGVPQPAGLPRPDRGGLGGPLWGRPAPLCWGPEPGWRSWGGSFLMGMAALALVLLLVGAARLERTGSLHPGGGHRLLPGGGGAYDPEGDGRPGAGAGRHRGVDHGQPLRHDGGQAAPPGGGGGPVHRSRCSCCAAPF